MEDSLNFALLCFTSFLTLINPLGLMPVFLTMTASLDSKAREKTARKAIIVAFIALIMFALTGEFIFNFFGISVNSFRVVGGIIFFIMGMDMLNARLASMKIKSDEVKEYISDISITPLAIPMICGPGAITNSIVMWQDAGSNINRLIMIGVIATMMLITYLSLWGGSSISKFMGETGIKIMMRLMGLIVMVIAVEFFFSGLSPILKGIISN